MAQACFRSLYLLFLTLLLSCGQAISASSVTTETAPEITIRSFPFYSQNLMRSWWRPMRQHIFSQTGIIVRISTSESYLSLLVDSAQKSHDIYVVPDHFLSLMIAEHGAKPLVALNLGTRPFLFHHSSDSIEGLADLQGHCIAMTHEIALTSITAKQWLSTQNMEPRLNYRPLHLTSFEDVMLTVLKGECQAGVITSGIWRKLSAPIKEKMTLIEIPLNGSSWGGLSLLASADSNVKIIAEVRRALVRFGRDVHTAGYLNSPLYSTPSVFNKVKLAEFERRYASLRPLLQSYLSTGELPSQQQAGKQLSSSDSVGTQPATNVYLPATD